MAEHDVPPVLVGVIGKPRGNKGDVFVEPFTDFPERRFRAPKTLMLRRPGGHTRLQPMELEQSRQIADRLVLKFRGVDSISDAETLRGCRVFAADGEEVQLAEGSYYHHQLLGMAVLAENGDQLGTISGLLRTAGGDLLEVTPPSANKGQTILIPAVEEFCYDVDLPQGIIRVRLPEGLLEINR